MQGVRDTSDSTGMIMYLTVWLPGVQNGPESSTSKMYLQFNVQSIEKAEITFSGPIL